VPQDGQDSVVGPATETPATQAPSAKTEPEQVVPPTVTNAGPAVASGALAVPIAAPTYPGYDPHLAGYDPQAYDYSAYWQQAYYQQAYPGALILRSPSDHNSLKPTPAAVADLAQRGVIRTADTCRAHKSL